jgi:hypothetical protein
MRVRAAAGKVGRGKMRERAGDDACVGGMRV